MTKKAAPRITGQAVNRAELADIMGCAKTTVDAWIKAGCPVAMQSPKRGVAHVFDTAAVIKWHVAGATFALVGKVDGATNFNLEHERARQAKASADKLEMENAEKRGLLAPVDQMALVWGAMLGNLKNRLLGMGAKLGPVIAPESRAPVCQSMIDGEIHEALIDLADYDPGTDLALIPGAGNGDAASGDDVAPAAKADDKRVGRRRKAA